MDSDLLEMRKAGREKRLPAWITLTPRQWKARKRREAKAVVKAIDKLLCGITWTPDGGETDTAARAIEALLAKMQAKEWGIENS